MTERERELEAEVKRLRAQLEARERSDYVRRPYHPDDDVEADDYYRPGCGEYDTRDSKGYKLRPRVNEAGEPYWM